ncbi:hypothetical protein B0H11DRAFT_1907479 [Mycena galericulata]|nr:hypothetical protein B0H11DRAFT_1907479 [Mycena galericulata]
MIHSPPAVGTTLTRCYFLPEKLERREVARQAGKPANLIPRPKGQPGRSSGYNLQDAMELSDDSEHYCRLYRIVKDVVHQFLPVTKTISQQDKTRVDATIVKIAKLAPYFARFAGYWPAHDMIRTYLLNMQTRRNKDLELEKKWMEGELGENDEAEDADAGTETLEMDGEDLEMDDMEEEEDEANDFADYSPWRTEETKSAKKNDAKQASKKAGKAVQPPRATLTAQTGKQKKTEQPLNSALVAKTNPKKRKNVEPPAEEPAAKKVKNTKPTPPSPPKKSLKPAPRQRKQVAKPTSLEWDDIPKMCPTVMCDDPLPETRNERILSLFVKRQGLISEVGSRGPGVSFTELQICAAITQEKHREKYIELDKQNQWPQIIDYNTVPARILKLKDSLLKMIQDPDVLQTSFIWKDFISRIDSQIFKFASSASKLAFTDALYGRRCGYYGPKGEFLINSTLLRILSKEEEALSYKLYDTLSRIIDEAPDTLKDFVAFILTPFTAALLIAEDRNISLEDATDVQDASNNFGDMMQPDDDDLTIEDLHRKNIRAMSNANNPFFSQPPRYRKPAFLGLQIETKPFEIESKQEVNSKSQLEESKPMPKGTGKPAPKPKNTTGKNKPAGKAKIPKKNPSQDNNVSTAGGYGTRSKSKMKSESE